jgi:outer membrane protein assembly factor BamA
MKLLHYYIVFLFTAFYLTGCNSENTTEVAKSYLEKTVHDESDGALKMTLFEKINGVEQEGMGQGFYTLEFQIDVEATKACFINEGFDDFGTERHFLALDKKGLYMYPTWKLNEGDKYQLTGEVILSKWEKGWQATDYSLKRWKKNK